MKQIDINVNNHDYTLACDDGQENHVAQLASEVDVRAKDVAAQIPQASETMVLVMTALMLADELYESRQEAGGLHEKLSQAAAGEAAPVDRSQTQEALAVMVDEMAQQIENMAFRIEKPAA